MIFNIYKTKKLQIDGKKIKLPISIKQYEFDSYEKFKKTSPNARNKYLYSYKYYGIDYRKKLCNILIKKHELSEVCKEILATYLIETYKDEYILSTHKENKYKKFEIPFSYKEEEDWWIDESVDSEIPTRRTVDLKYKEKQTKLYKLSRVPYDTNKSGWVTANVDNVFQFHGVFYQIDKSNKNYKCDAENSSPMDKVFCAYCDNGVEFYDMNIKKINVNKC